MDRECCSPMRGCKNERTVSENDYCEQDRNRQGTNVLRPTEDHRKARPKQLQLVVRLFTLGTIEPKVGELGERSHTAARLRRIHLGIDYWFVLADRSGGKTNFLCLGIDAQNLEIHLLTDLHYIFRPRNSLVGEL